MKTDPLRAYRHTRIKTATQGQLIVMLYDEGLRQLKTALTELESSQPRLDLVHNAIVKSQDIITELMVSLDFDKGGEIAPKLFGLYRFFSDQLMDANINKKSEPLALVSRLMSELRGAWAQILGKTNVEGGAPAGVNIAG